MAFLDLPGLTYFKNKLYAEKGKADGFASLNNSAKIPLNQLSQMNGASSNSAGKAGLVPAPSAGDQSKLLRGDGTWEDPIKPVSIPLDSVTNTSGSYAHTTSDIRFTEDMKALLVEFSNPEAFKAKVSVTIGNGTATLTCNEVSGTSDVSILVMRTMSPDEAYNTRVIYGFHIDGSESDPEAAVTYLAGAVGMTPAGMDYTNNRFKYGSWKDAFFMPRPCMLTYDGVVDYYLDENDYSKKEDGTASDVANTSYNGNAMMEWGRNGKKIWYKIVPDDGDDTSASVYIADYQADEYYRAWSFINNQGDYVDHFYTPCYFGTIVNNGTADVLRSLSGQSGANRCKNKNATTERDMARRNHATKEIWSTEVYSDIILINLLLVLMGKNLNTQTVFGQGLHTSGTDAINDSFTSGQHDNKGLFYGTNSGAVATYTNAVKVFGMENYWGYMWRRFEGLINVNGTAKYKLTRGTQDGTSLTDYAISTSASSYSGYLTSGSVPSASGMYVGQMHFNQDQFTPKTAGGESMDASHYYCDGFWANNSQVDYALRGGNSDYGSKVGAFSLYLNRLASYTAWAIGAAPSCKPLSQEG